MVEKVAVCMAFYACEATMGALSGAAPFWEGLPAMEAKLMGPLGAAGAGAASTAG